MFTPDPVNCTNCQFSITHTERQHTDSVRLSKMLAVDLDLARKAPEHRQSKILPNARRGMNLFGGV